MPWMADLAKRLGHKQWFANVGKLIAPPLDRALIKVSGGRWRTSDKGIVPTLLLTHTGRKTGKTRTTPLLFLRDGDALIVVGSNWGQEHDPAWALNLVANPRASVQVGRDRWDVVARVVDGEDRERLWTRLREVWPAYDTYETRASNRTIKVFRLDRA
jgi:deazaflavin-dependent oxidoreductase (nitroreductase family)